MEELNNYFKKFINEEQKAENEEYENLNQINDKKILEKLGYLINNIKLYKSNDIYHDCVKITFTKSYYNKNDINESMKIINSSNKFSNGDIVSLKNLEDKLICEGRIYLIKPFHIDILFKNLKVDISSLQNNIFCLSKQGSNATFDLFNNFLKRLNKYKSINFLNDELVNNFSNVILNKNCSNFFEMNKIFSSNINDIKFFDDKLNEYQKLAVNKALGCKYYYIIHGPPGTGKTQTISEIIRQLAFMNKNILVCASSNIAVDNILYKLSDKINPEINKFEDKRLLRIGNPSIINKALLEHSYDYIVYKNLKKNSDLRKLKVKNQSLINNLKNLKNKKYNKEIKEKKLNLKDNIKNNNKDIKSIEKYIKKEIFDNKMILFSTLNYLFSKILINNFEEKIFDYIIIDEAAQSLDISIMMGIIWAKKVILAGDHEQLEPTIKMNKEEAEIYKNTLFNKLVLLGKHENCYTILKEQYRMNEFINSISNKFIYNSIIKSNISNSNHVIMENSELEEKYDFKIFKNLEVNPLILIDTSSNMIGEDILDKSETKNFLSQSKSNKGEAVIVLELIKNIKENINLNNNSWGIITPYSFQCDWINNMISEQIGLLEEIKCATVDSFQGQEKDIIIISLVRSNPQKEIGFLENYKRLNVAITRAKKLLIVIGNKSCCSINNFIKNIFDEIEKSGVIWSTQELAYDFEIIEDYFKSGSFTKIENNKNSNPDNIKKKENNNNQNKKKRKRKKNK